MNIHAKPTKPEITTGPLPVLAQDLRRRRRQRPTCAFPCARSC